MKGTDVAIEFKLPELGENIEQGDLVRVMVKPGDDVAEGQPVIELETDKAVIEVPSNVQGKVKDIPVKAGQKVKVGQTIFTVEGDGGGAAPAREEKRAEVPTEEKPKVEVKTEASVARPAQPRAAAPTKTATSSAGGILEFKLPELGENIEQGDVVRVMIKPGDAVKDGQPVIELETDKAVVEVPSSVSGTVKEVLVREGQKAKVGAAIFTFEGGVAEIAAEPVKAPAQAEPDEVSHAQLTRQSFQAAREAEGKSEREAFPPDAHKGPTHEIIPPQLVKNAGEEHRGPVPASPAVRRLAREIGVDVYEVKGSGPNGRISEADVKNHAKAVIAGAVQAASAPGVARPEIKLPDFAKWGAIEKVPMRGVRRKTAEHLAVAWTTIPHVTQHDKADITELEELRKKFAPKAELAGGKMTVTAIALKVIASALNRTTPPAPTAT